MKGKIANETHRQPLVCPTGSGIVVGLTWLVALIMILRPPLVVQSLPAARA